MKPVISLNFVMILSCVIALFILCKETLGYYYCDTKPSYSDLSPACYVDSKNGNDQENGLTPITAVRSQGKIPAGTKVVYFKRGSVFNEKLVLISSAKVYTNYGDSTDSLPRFVVPTEPMSGPVINSIMRSGITFDGLYFAGARGNGTMDSLIGGIAVMLGPKNRLINCEITSCDIGAMCAADSALVQGCYIHDLIMGVDEEPGVDPNLVGGAEGVFVNASYCEIAYNTFVNCSGPAKWVGANGGCDGGAVEITALPGKELTGAKFHHNFSLDNCGFFEAASWFGNSKGMFNNSEFYSNVIVNSGWMGLLQVNNTDFENIHFYNNTLVQHVGSINAGILFIVFTDTSSGMSGGELKPGTVFLTNNLYVLDSLQVFTSLIDSNFVQSGNKIINTINMDPGFVNIRGKRASDYALKATSPARGAGTELTKILIDYFNQPVADLSHPDAGAFQYGTDQGSCLPRMSMYDQGGNVITATRPVSFPQTHAGSDAKIRAEFRGGTAVLKITGSRCFQGFSRISVYNFRGQKMFETVTTTTNATFMVSLPYLGAGMYIVKVQDGRNIYTDQIVSRG